MKLKKIASLMMAGVMAVSMLAGCQNANVKPEDPEDPVDPGVSSISTDVEALVADWLDPTEIPAYVDFADSADLNDDLEYAVEYAGVTDILPGYILSDGLTEIDDNDVYSRLFHAVNATGGNVDVFSIGSNDVLTEAENVDGYNIDDAVAFKLYAVSSAIGENAVKELVAEAVAGYGIHNYKYSIEDTNGGNYNHEYTVSVSTYTKTVNSSIVGGGVGGTGVVGGAENPAVTFVAVQVVRTSTHQ